MNFSWGLVLIVEGSNSWWVVSFRLLIIVAPFLVSDVRDWVAVLKISLSRLIKFRDVILMPTLRPLHWSPHWLMLLIITRTCVYPSLRYGLEALSMSEYHREPSVKMGCVFPSFTAPTAKPLENIVFILAQSHSEPLFLIHLIPQLHPYSSVRDLVRLLPLLSALLRFAPLASHSVALPSAGWTQRHSSHKRPVLAEVEFPLFST